MSGLVRAWRYDRPVVVQDGELLTLEHCGRTLLEGVAIAHAMPEAPNAEEFTRGADGRFTCQTCAMIIGASRDPC